MDSLIDWLPKNIPPETRHHDRARRLPPRQHDLPSDRAAHPRGARLGAVDARRSARRFRLPLHELAHPAGQFRGIAGLDLAALGIPTEKRIRRERIASAPGGARSIRRTGTSTWPTTCSASPRSCRASRKRVVDGTAASAARASRPASARGRMAELGWQAGREKILRRAA